MTIKKILKRIDSLREHLSEELGSSKMDLVNELVKLELKAKAESNK